MPIIKKTIDPLNLQNGDDLLLGFFLNSKKEVGFLFANSAYSLRIEGADTNKSSSDYEITLTHSIVHRKKLNEQGYSIAPKDVYEVFDIDNKIGSGKFGKVVRICSSISIESNKAVIKPISPQKSRVVKLLTCGIDVDEDQNSRNEYIKFSWKKEAKFAMKSPYLRAKGLRVFSNEDLTQTIGLIVMRELNGNNLESILTKYNFSKIEALNISINILKAYIVEIQESNILHRDIKPANIIVDMSTNEVHFCDFGSTKKLHENDQGSYVGTLGYIPIEAIAGHGTNEKSDLYSLALVIGELFNATPLHSILSKTLSPEKAENGVSTEDRLFIVEECKKYKFENIFDKPSKNYFDDIERLIFITLTEMMKSDTDYKPSEYRISINDAIKKLEEARLKLYVSLCKTGTTIQTMSTLSKIKPLADTLINISKHSLLSNNLVNVQFYQLKEGLISCIKKCKDRNTLNYCLDLLNIQSLKHNVTDEHIQKLKDDDQRLQHSKEKISRFITKTVNEIESNYSLLTQYLSQLSNVDKPPVLILENLENIRILLNKYERCCLNFDHIHTLNEKTNRVIKKISGNVAIAINDNNLLHKKKEKICNFFLPKTPSNASKSVKKGSNLDSGQERNSV